MPQATIEGWAIPTSVPYAEHTYVVGGENHRWGCCGRREGGHRVCEGVGELDLATCLARPDGRAGIRDAFTTEGYGLTGVCHQAANRILLPTGQTVRKAGGAMLSRLTYGVYGKDWITGNFYSPLDNPWPELQECRNPAIIEESSQ